MKQIVIRKYYSYKVKFIKSNKSIAFVRKNILNKNKYIICINNEFKNNMKMIKLLIRHEEAHLKLNHFYTYKNINLFRPEYKDQDIKHFNYVFDCELNFRYFRLKELEFMNENIKNFFNDESVKLSMYEDNKLPNYFNDKNYKDSLIHLDYYFQNKEDSKDNKNKYNDDKEDNLQTKNEEGDVYDSIINKIISEKELVEMNVSDYDIENDFNEIEKEITVVNNSYSLTEINNQKLIDDNHEKGYKDINSVLKKFLIKSGGNNNIKITYLESKYKLYNKGKSEYLKRSQFMTYKYPNGNDKEIKTAFIYVDFSSSMNRNHLCSLLEKISILYPTYKLFIYPFTDYVMPEIEYTGQNIRYLINSVNGGNNRIDECLNDYNNKNNKSKDSKLIIISDFEDYVTNDFIYYLKKYSINEENVLLINTENNNFNGRYPTIKDSKIIYIEEEY